MRFFKGTGDSGKTHLAGGMIVKKDNPALDLIGTIDELNSFIGFAISFLDQPQIVGDLQEIQLNLSQIMGEIANQEGSSSEGFDIKTAIKCLEERIEKYSDELENPRRFTFPGKTQSGAVIDICRTATRRLERKIVAYIANNTGLAVENIGYVNRLSSLFYVLRLYIDKF